MTFLALIIAACAIASASGTIGFFLGVALANGKRIQEQVERELMRSDLRRSGG